MTSAGCSYMERVRRKSFRGRPLGALAIDLFLGIEGPFEEGEPVMPARVKLDGMFMPMDPIRGRPLGKAGGGTIASSENPGPAAVLSA
jgi:hypothetical protein